MNCLLAAWRTAARCASWSPCASTSPKSSRARYSAPAAASKVRTRAQLNTVEDSGDYVKVNPLAHLSREDLESYAKENDLPVNTRSTGRAF